MTIFRRKNMTSFISALRHNISIKRSPSKPPAPSRTSSASRCCIPRQKKVLDFNAYFADQLEDDDDDGEMMRADDLAVRGDEEEGAEDQERGESSCDEDDLDDDDDDDNHSVIIDTDDSGTIVMTVVHRCPCGRQPCQEGGQGESEAAGRNRKLGCQEQAFAVRGEENCVDFCNQQLDSLRLARS